MAGGSRASNRLPMGALLVLFVWLTGCGQPDTFPASPLRSSLPPVELPAVMSVTNTSGAVITPQQAGAVVRAFWPLNERAKATNDQRLTDMLETGPAAEFDDAVTLDNLQRPHLPNLRIVRPLNGVEVFVPLQTSFPAYFLADVLTTVYGTSPEGDPPGTATVDVFVFVRPDASTSWRAALRTFGPTRLGVITNPLEPSYLPTLTGTHLVADPKTMPLQLAAYWQQYYITGAPPASIFAPGRWTTEKMEALLRTVRKFAADTGIREQTEYFIDLKRDGLYEFAVNGGYDLTCFTVRYATVQTRPGGRALHQDSGRDNYGGSLAPGEYRRISTSGLRQTCAWVPPVGYQGAGILVMGHEGGDLVTTGIPAGTS